MAGFLPGPVSLPARDDRAIAGSPLSRCASAEVLEPAMAWARRR